LPISILNLQVHGPPKLLWAPGRHPGCTPLSWGLTGTSSDCDKTLQEKGTSGNTLHLGSDRIQQIVLDKTTVQLDLVNFMLCC